MKLSFDETKALIDLVLKSNLIETAQVLHERLVRMGRNQAQFYDGVIEHGPFMDYTSEQWFDFHRKVPHWRLRDDERLMNKSSPIQRDRLISCR